MASLSLAGEDGVERDTMHKVRESREGLSLGSQETENRSSVRRQNQV